MKSISIYLFAYILAIISLVIVVQANKEGSYLRSYKPVGNDEQEQVAPKLDDQDDTKDPATPANNTANVDNNDQGNNTESKVSTKPTEVAEKGRWFKCDNRQQKKGDKWKKCRIMKKNKVQEFSFQEYLLSKGCPKFEKKAIKEALICWGDQTPCKEYDMEELVNAFEGCNKIKTARDNLKKAGSDGQNDLDKPVAKPTKPVTIFNEKFKGRLRENLEKRGYSSSAARVDMTYRTKWEFRLSTDYGVRVSNMLGNNEDRKDGTAMVFIGNKMGKSSDSSGSRYITTKPLDITKGGLISFYLKDGPDDGDKGCMATTEVFRKKEAKRLARRQNETNGRDKCLNKPPCNGHGEGVYSSNCYKNGSWVQGARLAKDEYTCHDPEAMSCTCKCNIGYKAPDCKSSSLPNTRDGYSRCRSVGDPHPNTANGVNFNIYDAGEFVWSRHPDVMVEAHLMTVPRGSVAVNNGMSIRKCAGTGGNKDGKMEGPCDTVSMVRCNFKLESGGKCMSKDRSFTSPLGIKVTAHTISVDGWSIQYSCGGYMDSYLTINSPRDGKSKGLCGYYGKQGAGGDRKNGNFLASSGSRGAHHMTSRAFFNSPLTIKTGADSHFKCHSFPSPNFNGRFHFKRIMSRITSAKSMAKMDKADAGMGMKMREQATTKMLKSYRMWSLANMKDPKGNEVSIEEATKKCEAKIKHCSGLPVADKSAMVACVQDYIKVGREDGHMVLNAACDVVKEDEDNAMEDVEADERDEKLELAGEAALRVPSKTDLIVQWCVESCTSPETQKCKDARDDIMDNPLSEKTMEEVNKLCIWKQLKAFPAKLYAESNLTKDWRHMTMRVPQEAIDRTLNPINPANKGRVNMRLRFFQQAHSCFCCDVFGIDDVKVIAGGWPVRILADSKFTLYADGKEIGSGEYNELKEIYRYRVDPSSKIFAVKVDSKGKNKGGFIASIGDSIVSSSTWKCKPTLDGEDVKALVEPKMDDSNWEKAVEIGTNEGEGAIPWGTVPGIASKAFWIYTHDGYMNKPSSATCRIDTNDAWHSYSKTHLGASRWSCKSLRDRQSPFSVSLDSKSIKIAEPKQWSDDSTLETKVQPIGNSVTSYAEDNRNSVILMKVAIEDLVDKTTEGAMVKTAMLRLFVTDPSEKGFKYCMNTKPWKANEITYKSFAENMEGTVTDCKSIKAKNKDEFVALDISDYFRKWVTDEKTNFGISIMHQGDFKDAVGFSTGNVKGQDAVQKPRLNLACHGDHVRGDMVFKERKVTLLKENKRGRK